MEDMHFDTQSTGRRTIVDLRDRGFHDVPVVGHYRYLTSMPPLGPESHERFVEVCLMVKGEQVYRLGSLPYRLRGKHVLLVPPGETFSTGGEPEMHGELYWLFLRLADNAADETFLGFTSEETRRIQQVLVVSTPRIHRAPERLIALVERLFVAASIPEDQLGSASVRVALMDVVLELCNVVNGADAAPAISAEIARVVDHLDQNPGQVMSLARLASIADLSVSRFKERFSAEVGFTPNVYANYVRIRVAKEELARGELDITAIAYDLGFSSSAYFSHVFRKYTGLSPSDYRSQYRVTATSPAR